MHRYRTVDQGFATDFGYFQARTFLEIVWGSSFPFPYVANQVNGGLLWPALQGTENAGAIHVGAWVMFWRGGVVV